MDHATATNEQNGMLSWSEPYDAEIVSLQLYGVREKARAIAAAIEQFETLPRRRLPVRPAGTA